MSLKSSFLSRLLTEREALFLIFLLFAFIILRIPSLIEPYWYGDEGVYQVVGQAMRAGRILYSEIWDNKPPLLYIIYAILNGDLFYVRFASLISGVISVTLFFLLAKKLFKNRIAIYISSVVYASLFGLPLLEGNIANSENFMHAPIIAAFYLIVIAGNKNRFILTTLAGFLLSLAFLIKIVAIFDLAAIALSIFILRFYEDLHLNRRNLATQFKNMVMGIEQETLLVIAFIFPILVTGLYFLFVEAFWDFWKAVLSQNVGYVGHGNYFLFPMGLLFLKLFLLLFLIFLIARYRKIVNPHGVIIFLWVLFALFNALFSQRPYTHYLLVLLPSLSLFIGYVIENKKLVKLTVPILAIIFILIGYNFRLNFKKTVLYYGNYASFVIGSKSTDAYQAFFDRNTPRDYEIARFIRAKTNENDSVFIWGDNPQIYALSGKLPPGRYTVSYHITFYPDAIEETKRDIEAKKPKYIIQIKETSQIENFLDKYELKYMFSDTKIYERQS